MSCGSIGFSGCSRDYLAHNLAMIHHWCNTYKGHIIVSHLIYSTHLFPSSNFTLLVIFWISNSLALFSPLFSRSILEFWTLNCNQVARRLGNQTKPSLGPTPLHTSFRAQTGTHQVWRKSAHPLLLTPLNVLGVLPVYTGVMDSCTPWRIRNKYLRKTTSQLPSRMDSPRRGTTTSLFLKKISAPLESSVTNTCPYCGTYKIRQSIWYLGYIRKSLAYSSDLATMLFLVCGGCIFILWARTLIPLEWGRNITGTHSTQITLWIHPK